MRNEQHYRNLLKQNPGAGVGFNLAAAAVYAARYGLCEPEHHGTPEWGEIARRLKSAYGETLTVDEVTSEMDAANKSAAAAMLGRLGGSVHTEAKRAAARENGKRGGRPRKTTERP